MLKRSIPAFFIILFSMQLYAQAPPKLIVRGDDMGYSHSGNLALIKSYQEGIQTSIEVIVPSPWFPEAVKMLAENPGSDVGIHLALTSEWDNVKWRPLTQVPSLTDQDGYFLPMSFPNPNYPGLSIHEADWKISDIEQELRAQIEMAKKYIPQLSHVSSHMGFTRIDPEINELVKKLAKEYEIDIDPGEYEVRSASYEGLNWPATTKAGFKEKEKAFIAMLRKLEKGKAYLFVDHPGLDNEELKAISHIGYETVAMDRQGVTDVFTSKKVKAVIKELGIELIGYKDLKK